MRLGLAVVCLAIGVVLVVLPGPAVVFFFIAGALLATEFLGVARLLDWGEVQCRKVLGWAKERWERLETAGRTAVFVLAGGGSLAVMYALYRILRD